jgi:hypothetical protein
MREAVHRCSTYPPQQIQAIRWVQWVQEIPGVDMLDMYGYVGNQAESKDGFQIFSDYFRRSIDVHSAVV